MTRPSPAGPGMHERRKAWRWGVAGAVVAAAGVGVAVMVAALTPSTGGVGDPFAGLGDRPTRPPVVAPVPSPPGDAGGGGGVTPAADPSEGDVPAGSPVTFLILGSDSRTSDGDPSQWDAGGQRTDVIMVAQVSGGRDAVHVMSIPRDSWVTIPRYGDAKINAAYSYGGPSLMVETVESLTGIPIDHVAVADFDSFSAMTDALGGVRIDLPDGMNFGGVNLPPGVHTLDGGEALTYVRDRFNVPGGDFGRVERQQNWVRAILQAAVDGGVMDDPARMAGFARIVLDSVSVDSRFGFTDAVSLGLSLRGVTDDDVVFMTAPTEGVGWSPDGRQSVVFLDDAGLGALSDAFVTDSVSEFVSSGQVGTLGDVVH